MLELQLISRTQWALLGCNTAVLNYLVTKATAVCRDGFGEQIWTI